VTGRLDLETWIAARPETVFGFFTDPADFASWMGGMLGRATLEPRPGGALRVDFGPNGVALGEVIALEAPRRFAFTWGYESGEPFPAGSTTVEITLSEEGGGTRLVLTHTLPTDALAKAHGTGWRLYTSMLASGAARREHGERIPGLVAAWFAAWNGDEEALVRCLADDARFREEHAALAGRDDVAAHIRNSRMFMPGIAMRSTTVSQCHELVRFGWEAVRGDEVLARGENLGELGPDGRFARVWGFRS
jgi:uncharacterized protein YndB with AHSA1/START domain